MLRRGAHPPAHRTPPRRKKRRLIHDACLGSDSSIGRLDSPRILRSSLLLPTPEREEMTREMGKHRRQLFDDHLQQLRQRGDAERTSTPRARRSTALILFHYPRQFLRLRLVGHRPGHASPSPTTHGLASIALSSLPSPILCQSYLLAASAHRQSLAPSSQMVACLISTSIERYPPPHQLRHQPLSFSDASPASPVNSSTKTCCPTPKNSLATSRTY
ncbi:hypothetical protein R3P38DRAFT_3218126 [Favolaschia claudopus]|uniref:Uncharacterized protein n=1 Tax=Favolaschia claudopus TaxID=2862362 RepID=A0AAW0A409_9AGAR